MISKAQVTALCAGDGWLEKGANLLLFGPPGGGKSHLASAIGLSLVEKGWRVLFTRTSDLVQKLQLARRELVLEAAIQSLDRYHLVILDDLVYVAKDQAETSVLFELISTRYERRSLLITANQPFGERGKIFQDPAMTLAAVDRLVHHATIFEMNGELSATGGARSKEARRRTARKLCNDQECGSVDAERQSNGDIEIWGYQAQGSREIVAPGALHSVAAKTKQRKNAGASARLRRQTAPAWKVRERSKNGTQSLPATINYSMIMRPRDPLPS